MKVQFLFVFVLQFIASSLWGQVQDSLAFDVEDQAIYFEQELMLLEDYLSEEEQELWVKFKVDTFRIERILEGRMVLNPSTMGTIDAIHEAEASYDQLLNRYYKKLMNRLEPADQEVLRQAQRQWIKFRDAEKALINQIYSDTYTGGGTMYNIFIVHDHYSLTRQRVFELFHHCVAY